MTVKASPHPNDQVLKVERKYYEQEELNTELSYSKPQHHGKFIKIIFNRNDWDTILKYSINSSETIKSIFWNHFQPKQFFFTTFPILTWLSQYNVKTDLLGDVISGFTVAVMHIPQGMFT